MKISIITIHSIINCGSVLQAFALQAYLKKRYPNADVEIIDYKYPNEYHFKERASKQCFIERLRYKLHIIRITLLDMSYRQRIAKFKAFRLEQLCLSKPYNTPHALLEDFPKSDIYITGSDQVWNTKTVYGDSSFLLSFVPEGKYRFTYAASFGIDYVHKEYKDVFFKYLNRYNSISVRETNGHDIIEKLGIRKDVKLVCDPTLLLKQDDYNELSFKSSIKLDKEYILVYYLKYAFNPQPGILVALNTAVNKYKCNVVFIGHKIEGFKGDYLRLSNVGPYDFVKLFSAAKFVVTSSFHGTAFSVIFRKPFISVTSRKGDRRLSDFLETIGMEKCMVYNDQNMIVFPERYYDDFFEESFNRYRFLSEQFIGDNISKYREEYAEHEN